MQLHKCKDCESCGTVIPKKSSGKFLSPDGKTTKVGQVNIPYCIKLNMSVSPQLRHSCTQYKLRVDKTPTASYNKTVTAKLLENTLMPGG